MTGGFHKAATIRHVHRQHQLASSGQQCSSQGHQCAHPCHQVRGVKENVMTQKSIYKVLTPNGSLKDTIQKQQGEQNINRTNNTMNPTNYIRHKQTHYNTLFNIFLITSNTHKTMTHKCLHTQATHSESREEKMVLEDRVK